MDRVRKPLLIVTVAAGLALASGSAFGQGGGRATSPAPMPPGSGEMMEHPARPFYREGTFHVLVGVAAAGGALVAYRALRSRRRRQPAPAGFVTEAVMAVDLVDSTHLATHYGSAVALRARNALENRARQVTEAHGRTFIETTGDGCLATFPSITAAVDAAVALLRNLQHRPPEVAPGTPLEVRIGISYGEILLDDRDVRHGAPINKAFRLVSLSADSFAEVKGEVEAREIPDRTRIFLDEDAAHELRAATVPLRFVGFSKLKGFSGLHGVYEVAWQRGSNGLPHAAPSGSPAGRSRDSNQQGGMQ